MEVYSAFVYRFDELIDDRLFDGEMKAMTWVETKRREMLPSAKPAQWEEWDETCRPNPVKTIKRLYGDRYTFGVQKRHVQ